MQIEIQAKGFELTEALREHTQRRVRLALSAISSHVQRIDIRLSDVNGPRGGADKRCTIRAGGIFGLTIEDTQADLYAAIDRAVDRLKRGTLRKLERVREYPHVRHSVSALN